MASVRYMPAAGTSARYEEVPNWPVLPHGVTFHNETAGIAVNSKDEVHIFNRGPVPMVVCDREGTYLRSWGAGEFDAAHSIFFDADDDMYLVDRDGCFVQKRDPDGNVLLTIGTRGQPCEPHSGGCFNWPTDAVVHPRTGEIFVSDGYNNSRIHRFAPDGTHILSWGEPGADPGQFQLPHGLCVLDDDRVVVCDRENFRLQIFTVNGEFLDLIWMHRPIAVRSHGGLLYVAESGPNARFKDFPNYGHRIAVLDLDGKVVARFGAPEQGSGPGEFVAPHGVAIDSHGDVYVAEVTRVALVLGYGEAPPLGELKSVSRWVRTE
jgi:DNA-binding beta-propeller fold protein YncE